MINENNRRPATSLYSTDYIAPVKAAGDVSLSGFQLVQFLIKATYRLPVVTFSLFGLLYNASYFFIWLELFLLMIVI